MSSLAAKPHSGTNLNDFQSKITNLRISLPSGKEEIRFSNASLIFEDSWGRSYVLEDIRYNAEDNILTIDIDRKGEFSDDIPNGY